MKEFKKLIDCLNKQVNELEGMCKSKDARICELEKKISDLEGKSNNSTWSFNGWFAEEACSHEYPNPWFGTIPPSCSKCGQKAKALHNTNQWR